MSKTIILGVFFVLTIPYAGSVVYESLNAFVGVAQGKNTGPIYISIHELSALSFLKTQDSGVVYHYYSDPDTIKKQMRGDNRVWASEDTAYVTALSGKVSYFTHVNQLHMLGVPYETRADMMRDPNLVNFETLPVDYYYLVKAHPYHRTTLNQTSSNILRPIFDNSEVLILEKIKAN